MDWFGADAGLTIVLVVFVGCVCGLFLLWFAPFGPEAMAEPGSDECECILECRPAFDKKEGQRCRADAAHS